eukprot:12908151-Prorocentrum_lima.AAC.1
MASPKNSKRGESRTQPFQLPAQPVSVQKSYAAIVSVLERSATGTACNMLNLRARVQTWTK